MLKIAYTWKTVCVIQFKLVSLHRHFGKSAIFVETFCSSVKPLFFRQSRHLIMAIYYVSQMQDRTTDHSIRNQIHKSKMVSNFLSTYHLQFLHVTSSFYILCVRKALVAELYTSDNFRFHLCCIILWFSVSDGISLTFHQLNIYITWPWPAMKNSILNNSVRKSFFSCPINYSK